MTIFINKPHAFFLESQLMTSAPNNDFLSSNQDTNKLLM